MNRKQLVILTLIAAVSGTAAVTTVGLAGGEPPMNARPAPPADLTLQEDTAAIRTPSQADPRGGPHWSTIEFRSADGRWCAKPGRIVGGQVGSLNARGGVIGTSLKQGGDCVDVDQLSPEEPFAWHVSEEYDDPQTGARSPVSYVWGLARPEVSSVEVSTSAGTRTVPVSAGRAFIAVFPGRILLEAVKITAVNRNGGAKSVTLPAPSGKSNMRDLYKDPPTPEELKAAEPDSG